MILVNMFFHGQGSGWFTGKGGGRPEGIVIYSIRKLEESFIRVGENLVTQCTRKDSNLML